MNYETDSYVVSAIYLKNFLGRETVILYDDVVSGTENVIKKELPNAYVYVDTWEGDEIQRRAIKRKG
jgi:hypothetical protein